MTVLSLKRFGGEVPRAPAQDLPDSSAQLAINCNFAYGELRPLRGGFQISTLSNPAKSIFTLDGLTFFSWPIKTKAWKGPVIGDTFSRMYYSNDNEGFRVAYTSGTQINGGEPGTSFKVGVPRPTAALGYRLLDLESLPDYPNAAIKITSYYEAGGKRFDEAEVNATAAVAFREYTFTIAEPTSTSSETAGANAYQVSSFSYQIDEVVNPGEGGYTVTSTRTVEIPGGGSVTVLDASRVSFNGTTYTGVTSITPVSGAPMPPGELLQSDVERTGTAVPATAAPSVRVELIDTVKNTTIFSLSASSAVASARSDAIPGGVQAALVKNGTDANAWKVVLTYGVIETRAYVATILNLHNEESQPSDPVFATPTYMQSVELSLVSPDAGGYVPINRARFYRSVTGTYLSCTPSPVVLTGSQTVHIDSVVNITDTDAVLQTQAWGVPPAGLRNVTLLPNGFFAGFVGDTLYFSEPYAPWAWPYSMTFPFPLVGLRAIENGLVVTTNSYPYAVSGVHPAGMTQAQLSAAQAGISDPGMCALGGAVSFVSHDGVVLVNGLSVDIESFQKLFTRDVWRDRYAGVLSTMELSYYDGALIATTPTQGKSFELRLDEAGGAFTQLDGGFRADALFVLPATDQLYYVDGTALLQYRSGSDLTYQWHSKDFVLPKPTNFGAVYLNVGSSAGETVTFTIYADGSIWHTFTTGAPGYFRLPSGRKAVRWSFKLVGTATVKEVTIAERMEELRRV